MGRINVPQEFARALTLKMTELMQKELSDLEDKYDSGQLLVSFGRYRNLRHGIMNNYSVGRIQAVQRNIEHQVNEGITTWEEQLKLFGPKGKAKSRTK